MRLLTVRTFATVAVAGFALAACGSSSKAASPTDTTTTTAPAATTTTAPATSTTAEAAAASVKIATNAKLGKIVVDANGMTLYRFDADTVAGKSACGPGQCASTWPAATVTGSATAGTGIETAKLTTFTRDDGKKQLELAGHPLYTFAGDAKPGDTNGQGIIGKWYAVNADGDKVGDGS